MPGLRSCRAESARLAVSEDVLSVMRDPHDPSAVIQEDHMGERTVVAVASGKGGTGKTTVATNLAVVAAASGQKVQLLDCDVEAPNAHLFLKPEIEQRESAGVPVPEVDEEKCDACGECGRICQCSAIVSLKTKPLVVPELCHGCGGCALVCPRGAIAERPREVGVVEAGSADDAAFVGGKLRIGDAMAPPLIRAVAVIAVLALVSGCREKPGFDKSAQPTTLTIYAPWSMEKRLRRIFERFTLEHRNVSFRLQTGTPGRLVGLIRQGARPDVYVSMGPVGVEVLREMGLVREGSAKEILRQHLVLICSEPLKGKVTSLRDLARPDVQAVGMGRPTMSAGAFSRVALGKLGILEAVETKARISPFRSYMKGEVDAAIILEECCFDEDLLLGKVVARQGVNVVQVVPESLCPAFPVVAVAIKGRGHSETAEEFVRFLAEREAQDLLLRKGPGACPVCDGDTYILPARTDSSSPPE